jgi:uncharacterized RDD family membrane protein YckC
MRVWARLRTWADEEAAAARDYRRLADRAEGFKSGRFGPMQDPDLQTALDVFARYQPTAAWAKNYGGGFDEVSDFLKTSEERRDMEKARSELQRRWESRWQPLIAGVTVLGFLVVVLVFRRFLIPPSLDIHPGGDAASNISAQKVKLQELILHFGALSAVSITFAGLYNVATRLGQRVHRHYALPAIILAIKNPVKPVLVEASKPLIAGIVYAGWWLRALALVIDALVGFLIFGLTCAVLYSLLGVFAALPGLVCVSLYHLITEGSSWQASLGMRATRTYLSNLDGSRPAISVVLTRQAIKLVFTLVPLVSLSILWPLLPICLIAFESLAKLTIYVGARRLYRQIPWLVRRQWFLDLASGTVVLARPKNT